MNPGQVDRLRRADERARAAAQVEFGAPLVLEAGAGTGKTATLVARVVSWSLGPGWERASADPSVDAADARSVAARVLSGLVAITFTEAAAAEMAGRVEQALSRVQRGVAVDGLDPSLLAADREDQQLRAEALLDTIENLGFHTIHAWCRSILARFPMEAGLHPLFEVDAAGEERERVVREVVEAALGEALVAPEANGLVELAARGIGPTRVESALVEWVAAGLEARELADPLEAQRIAAWWRTMQGAVRDLADLCVDALREVPRRPKNTLAAREALERTRERFAVGAPPGDLADLVALQAELAGWWTEGARKQVGKWSAGAFNTGEQHCLGAALPAVREAAAALDALLSSFVTADLPLLALAQRTLAPLLAEARDRLARHGILGFQDLLREARDLLRRREDVRARLRREIDGLLVDEFQDTDRLQCDVVASLALEGPVEERPWLFVVGDPKQSIYGWRSADLEAYEWFVGRVEGEGGSCLPLAVNHRSDPPILAEVERVVAPVMRRSPGLQPAFEPLLPCAARRHGKGFGRGPQAPVEHWVAWPPSEDGGSLDPTGKARQVAETEARALAADLRRLADEAEPAAGFRWSRVAVLMRALSDVEIYLRALREAGVPYVVGRDRSYYQRREIVDAAALVRCVIDPHDTLALLTFLRSPAVGVPDAALLPLWAEGLPGALGELWTAADDELTDLASRIGSAAARLPGDAPDLDRVEGWQSSLLGAIETLALLRQAYRSEPADRFVERLRHLWLGEATESARFLGAFRAANLERFFRELTESLGEGADATSLLRRLREGVAGEREVESATATGQEEDAVQILSIHGAKGLTFDHVYLMQLHKTPGGGKTPELEWARRDGRCEFRLFGEESLGYALDRRRAGAVAKAEQVRALYVAMTRPRLRLVLSGRWDAAPVGVEPDSAPHLLSLLASRGGGVADLPGLVDRLVPTGDGEPDARDGEDAVEARWRLPALIAPVPPVGSSAREGELGGRAERSIRRFELERAAAITRSRRPFSSRATAAGEPVDRDEGREARAPREPGGVAGGDAPSALRDRAMAVGTALHAVLEEWDTDRDPQEELVRQHSRLEVFLGGLVSPGELVPARDAAREALAAFAAGPLFERWLALAPRIVARELPVMRRPSSEDRGAVLFESGIIDLVYRDPETGCLVVADYKTDRVEGRADCEAKAAAYREQGEFYRETLREALALPEAPRFELWFIRAGEVIVTA